MNRSHGFTNTVSRKLGKAAQSPNAQRPFYDNLEDVINKSVSLQEDIARYQSTLKYARSRLEYSVGKGLYICYLQKCC